MSVPIQFLTGQACFLASHRFLFLIIDIVVYIIIDIMFAVSFFSHYRYLNAQHSEVHVLGLDRRLLLPCLLILTTFDKVSPLSFVC